MKRFTLKADAVFEAEDITDAMRRLAAHFSETADGFDEEMEEEKEPSSLFLANSSISVEIETRQHAQQCSGKHEDMVGGRCLDAQGRRL